MSKISKSESIQMKCVAIDDEQNLHQLRLVVYPTI